MVVYTYIRIYTQKCAIESDMVQDVLKINIY